MVAQTKALCSIIILMNAEFVTDGSVRMTIDSGGHAALGNKCDGYILRWHS